MQTCGGVLLQVALGILWQVGGTLLRLQDMEPIVEVLKARCCCSSHLTLLSCPPVTACIHAQQDGWPDAPWPFVLAFML